MKKYILGLSVLALVFSVFLGVPQNASATLHSPPQVGDTSGGDTFCRDGLWHTTGHCPTIVISPNLGGGGVLPAKVHNYTGTQTIFTKDLSIGSSGPDVKALQTLLIKNGLLSGNIDGKYGPNTAKAVMNLQGTSTLLKTGKVDVETRKLLNSFSTTLSPSSASLNINQDKMPGVYAFSTINLCPNGMTIASNCTIPPPISFNLCPNGMTIASNCTTPTDQTQTNIQGSCPDGYVSVAPVAPTFASCMVSTSTPSGPTQ